MFECKLKIDGLHKKLSLQDGLSIKELGEILSKLSKCLEKDGIKFTLVDVENSSYTPIIETEQEEGVDRFIAIHDQIRNSSYDSLDKESKDYADTLKTLLLDKGITLSAIDSKNNREVSITSITKKKPTKIASITTVTGRIVSLIGSNEDNPYITLKTSQGVTYKINISKDQEKTLNNFYKKNKIVARIKLPVKLKEDNPAARLIDYTVSSGVSFMDAISNVKEKFGDIFISISDSAKLLRELRNIEQYD